MKHTKYLGRKIRRVIHGWNIAFIWQYRAPGCDGGWVVNFDILHIGLEAGGYKGNYAELIVVIFGMGFYLEWYDQLTRSVWGAEMEQRIAEVKEVHGLEITDDE